jgi:hypothetical protein
MAFGEGNFCMSGVDYYCPYDHLPCSRYDKDLGFGVCEATIEGVSDVCSRFALKPNVMRVEFFCKEALGEVVARRDFSVRGKSYTLTKTNVETASVRKCENMCLSFVF